jgi:hypothetical protein
MTKANGKSLTTAEVSIQTVTVSIQALKVGTKQMTLSVLRQLVQDYPFNRDGYARGEVWGWVRYCAEDCSEARMMRDEGDWKRGRRPIDNHNHVTIVWCQDGKLRRWCDNWPSKTLEDLPQLFVAC